MVPAYSQWKKDGCADSPEPILTPDCGKYPVCPVPRECRRIKEDGRERAKRVGQNALRMIWLWIGRAFVGELLK
jgi:hypothetical protein